MYIWWNLSVYHSRNLRESMKTKTSKYELSIWSFDTKVHRANIFGCYVLFLASQSAFLSYQTMAYGRIWTMKSAPYCYALVCFIPFPPIAFSNLSKLDSTRTFKCIALIRSFPCPGSLRVFSQCHTAQDVNEYLSLHFHLKAFSSFYVLNLKYT